MSGSTDDTAGGLSPERDLDGSFDTMGHERGPFFGFSMWSEFLVSDHKWKSDMTITV